MAPVTLRMIVGLGAVLAAEAGQAVVQCAQPVEVRFLATPNQEKPKFSDEVLRTKFGCSLDLDLSSQLDSGKSGDIGDLNYINKEVAEGRMLAFIVDSDSNETNATEVETPATPTTTTVTAAAKLSNANTTNKTVAAEVGRACTSSVWGAGLAGLLSLSLPLAAASETSVQPRGPVDVLLPCSALLDRLTDLDGDGHKDCKMTQEQGKVAQAVPALEGTWQLSSPSAAAEHHEIIIGDGAWCVEQTESARWGQDLRRDQLPLVLTNVESFAHDGSRCSLNKTCDTSMWSFDLAYPTSGCTPFLGSWSRPCVAKLLADGTLLLVRGNQMQGNSTSHRAPLPAAVETTAEAHAFIAKLSAAADTHFEPMLLKKAWKANLVFL